MDISIDPIELVFLASSLIILVLMFFSIFLITISKLTQVIFALIEETYEDTHSIEKIESRR